MSKVARTGLALAMLFSVCARAGGNARVDRFRSDWDARLQERRAANDRAGVLDGVDEIALRLPNEPIAGVWLAAVLSAGGAPEAAADLASRWRSLPAHTAAARAWDAERSRQRELTFVVTADGAAVGACVCDTVIVGFCSPA